MEPFSLDDAIRNEIARLHKGAVDIGDGFTVEWGSHIERWVMRFGDLAICSNGATGHDSFARSFHSVIDCILEADRIKREEPWYLEKRTWPLEWKVTMDENDSTVYSTRSDVLNLFHTSTGILHQVVRRNSIVWILTGRKGQWWVDAENAREDIQREHDNAMRAKLKERK